MSFRSQHLILRVQLSDALEALVPFDLDQTALLAARRKIACLLWSWYHSLNGNNLVCAWFAG
jgi:hypothetical protein